ncbi:MAG: hypothetical protein D6791_13715 [Chloroflexi bacterium]|nr:MAG: hypothetical protein D6791_13715 [Chloroflexota bacterium]
MRRDNLSHVVAMLSAAVCFLGVALARTGDMDSVIASSMSTVLATVSGATKLTASDGATRDNFGISVAVSGDYAIVGAHRDDDNGTDSGSAYIFMRGGNNWVEQGKLIPGDGAADDRFGYSVAISGDYAIVGAYRDDDKGFDSGSAYIFVRTLSGWTEQAKLTAGDGAAGDNFGISVAIDGDHAIVGAYADDDNGLDSGSAYVFVRSGSTWSQQAKLTAGLDGATQDYFGRSVAISGDYAIVGAYRDDDQGTDSGSAYVFMRDATGWTQQAKLTAGDGADGDQFGWSVAIDGSYALVGAWLATANDFQSGSAYVFVRSGSNWVEQAKLIADDGQAQDFFGNSVSLSGAHALIGAYGDDDTAIDSGSAYVFVRNGSTWTQRAKLTARDGTWFDNFGVSVSVNGKYTLIGADEDDDKGASSGSAYVFQTCYDFSGDALVGVEDIQTVAAQWGKQSSDPNWDAIRQFDLDGDNAITIIDVMLVAAAWGTPCS